MPVIAGNELTKSATQSRSILVIELTHGDRLSRQPVLKERRSDFVFTYAHSIQGNL